jgi:hypothetical protein
MAAEDGVSPRIDDRRHASTLSRSAPSRGGRTKTVGALEKKAKKPKGMWRYENVSPLHLALLISRSSSSSRW